MPKLVTTDHEDKGVANQFIKSNGISTVEAEELLKIYGRNELEEKSTPKWLIFVSQFYQVLSSNIIESFFMIYHFSHVANADYDMDRCID